MATVRRLGGLAAVFAGLAILLGAPLAHAANTEARERVARKACLSGDYAKGVAILSDLFIDTMDANYIFNQARCFEQNSRYAEAISRFREYLRKVPNTSPSDRADTEKHIADCQALLGSKEVTGSVAAQPSQAEAVARPAPAAPQAALPPAGPPAPAAYASQPPATQASLPANSMPVQAAVADATMPAPTPSPGRGLRIAGIACGAVGVASVGTAIYFYTRAKSFSDKVAGENPRNPSDEQSGKNAQTMQWVFYGIGGAALATGTVLYLLGWPSTDTGHAAAGVAPMLGPGLAGISGQGAF